MPKHSLFLFQKRLFNDLVAPFYTVLITHTIGFDMGLRNGSALDKVPSSNLRKLFKYLLYSNLKISGLLKSLFAENGYCLYSLSNSRYSNSKTKYLHFIRCFPSLRNEKRHCCYNIITTISHVISSEGIHGTEKYVWSGLLMLLKYLKST